MLIFDVSGWLKGCPINCVIVAHFGLLTKGSKLTMEHLLNQNVVQISV